MTDTSTSQIPQTKPVSKPAQVSTELPYIEEIPSTIKPEEITTSTLEAITDPPEMPLIPTIQPKGSEQQPSIIDTFDEDEILHDDSDDGEPSTDVAEEPVMTTVETLLTEDPEQEEVKPEPPPEEDTDLDQGPSEQGPDTTAQTDDSMKHDDEESTTVAAMVDVSTSTSPPLIESTTAASTDCTYDDIIYKDKAEIPNENPCNLCFCNTGEIVCAIKECPTPIGKENCVALPAPEGKCCPEKFKCGE